VRAEWKGVLARANNPRTHRLGLRRQPAGSHDPAYCLSPPGHSAFPPWAPSTKEMRIAPV
jgi:hypothetical protein